VRLLPEAGHWVMADAPDVVNRALVDFLDAP
jgi:pimeloyl-ACP methyl ester carboxylesterase